MGSVEAFLHARDLLLRHRDDYDAAYREFRWPELDRFNWALDWFDRHADGNTRAALRIVDDAGGETALSFAELSERSNRVANFLRRQGARRGDRLLLMLGNVAPLWETMLAAMKLGVVVVPASLELTAEELRDRMERGGITHVVADHDARPKLEDVAEVFTGIAVGGDAGWWPRFEDAYEESAEFEPDGETRASDPLLLYFTSGNTSPPRPVLHTHASYPVGHLSTMYWIGLREDDVHWHMSSSGVAQHAWSSVFAPWNAGAEVFVLSSARVEARHLLEALARHGVTTLSAPPNVWRLLVDEDLKGWPVRLREAVSAGEPLDPEVIERVRRAWGLTVRDGYGQTETTAIVGNSPGQPLKPGSMGRALPGYRVALLDRHGSEGREGEMALRLDSAVAAVMAGSLDDEGRTASTANGGYYRTGDVASADDEGYLTYLGRAAGAAGRSG